MREVSVPFRGIGSEKLGLITGVDLVTRKEVSVPFRGIGSEKLQVPNTQLSRQDLVGFSPLSGNRF